MTARETLGRGRKYRHNVGKVINRIRERRCISMRQAALEIGVSMHTIFRAESFATIPNRPQYNLMFKWIKNNRWALGAAR